QRIDLHLGGLDLRVQFADRGYDLLDLRVAEFQRIHHHLFGDFQRSGLDHDDAFVGAGDDDVQAADFLLGNRRIGDELAIDIADAHAGDGRLEWEVGAKGRGRGRGNGDDVRVVLAVGGQDHADNLRFIAPGLREQRAHRPIDQARGQDFFFGGPAFALEEATWNLAGRI